MITVRQGIRDAPDRTPDAAELGIELWNGEGQVLLRWRGVSVDVRGTEVDVLFDEPCVPAILETLVQLALSWVLAEHDRYLVHAAAIGRDDSVVLVFGHTGAGKSTTTVAALDAGWWAISDDLVVVEVRAGALVAHGICQPPVAPIEIGGPLLAGATAVGDPRNRGEPRSNVLRTSRPVIAGTVLVGHSRLEDGELERVAGYRSMPTIVQSSVAILEERYRRSFVATAAALARLPSWRLGLSFDADRRRDAAAAALGHCFDELASITPAGTSCP